MSSDANYCLKDPQDQVVGFRLDAAKLGHEIYDILDWADEHFSSHVVEQTNDRVYVYSEAAQASLSADEIRAEPLSIENGEDPSNDDSSEGSSGKGPWGGSGGSDPGGNAPAGDPTVGDGGGSAAEPAGL